MGNFDLEGIKFLQSFSTPFLNELFEWITKLGEEYFVAILLTVIFWCIHKEYGYKLGLACLFSGVVNGMVKEALKVPRPFGKEGIFTLRPQTATGYSFPSGHTQGTTTVWASLMGQRKKKGLYVLGSAVILLVGASRVYLGCHTPTDVIGGIFFGILCLVISNWLFEYAKKRGRKWIFLVLLIPAFLAAFFFSSPDYFKSLGFFASFIVGYWIESSYICFNPHTKMRNQILKYLIGIGGLLGLKFGTKLALEYILKQALHESGEGMLFLWGEFLRYFILGIWVTVFAPMLFKMLFKAKDHTGRERRVHM